MVNMVTDKKFFVKTLILFFVVVCVVVAEHQKRDVHRIILQHRVPKNHNRGQAHNHHGRKQEPKYKKTKLGSQELFSNSFEDSGSHSYENSFENNHNQKTRKPSIKKSPILHRHHLHTNFDVQESIHHPYKKEVQTFYNEWLPVKYDNLTSNVFSHINREKNKIKKKSKKNTYRNIVHEDFDVLTNLPHNYMNSYKELTTSHNLNLEQSIEKGISYESSTLYPPIDVLSTFSDLNKKTLENNTLIIFDDNIQKDTLNALKNHNIINYDNNNESSDKDLGGYIVVPEKSEITSLENIHNKLNSKNRGSIRFNKEFQS